MADQIGRFGWRRLLNAVTANQGVPTLVTDGVAVPNNWDGRFAMVRIRQTATGARTATLTLYGYKGATLDEDGAAVTSSEGWVNLNESWSISGSANTDEIPSSGGLLQGIAGFQRLYVVVASISGTSTTISLDVGLTEANL